MVHQKDEWQKTEITYFIEIFFFNDWSFVESQAKVILDFLSVHRRRHYIHQAEELLFRELTSVFEIVEESGLLPRHRGNQI